MICCGVKAEILRCRVGEPKRQVFANGEVLAFPQEAKANAEQLKIMLAGRSGLFGPSMSQTPLRGASLRLSNFVPDKIVERGPSPVSADQNKKPATRAGFLFWLGD
jgi:hypothetical protein